MASIQTIVADWQAANGNVHSYHQLLESAPLVDSGPNGYTGSAAQGITPILGPWSLDNYSQGGGVDPLLTMPVAMLSGLDGQTGFTLMTWVYLSSSITGIVDLFYARNQDDVEGIRVFYNQSLGTVYVQVRPARGGSAYIRSLGGSTPTDQWVFLRLSMDLTNDRFIYRQGTAGADITDNIPFPPAVFDFGTPVTTPFFFAQSAGVGSYIGGTSNWIIIRDGDLSTADVDLFANADGIDPIEDAGETLQGADSVADSYLISMLSDTVRAMGQADAIGSTWNTPMGATSLISRDQVDAAFDIMATDGMSSTDALADILFRVLQGADTLQAMGVVSGQLEAVATAITAGALTDTAEAAYYLAAADTGQFVDVSNNMLLAYATILDNANFADSAAPHITISLTAEDVGTLTDGLSAQRLLEVLAGDGARFGDIGVYIVDPSVYYYGVVVNADTGATSDYTNVPFNSLAWFFREGWLLGSSPDGVFHIHEDYDSDFGDPIRSSVATAMSLLGDDRLKRVDSVVVGYTADSNLILKMRVIEHGQKAEYWYQLDPQVAEGPREGVIKVGKGLKSRYWQLEIDNRNGADFNLDSVTWYPVVTSRRRRS